MSALECDLASLSSVRNAGATLNAKLARGDLPPLTGFVGNAGLQMSDTTHETLDGYEMTFGVNVLANYALLESLLPQFDSHARILITTSNSHFGEFRHNLGMVPGPRWRPVDELAAAGSDADADSTESGRRAYSTSKLAVIYLVHELARRMPESEVFAYNPAFVPGTGLAREAGVLARSAFKLLLPAMVLTPLAMTPDAAGVRLARTFLGPTPGASGSYLDRGTAVPSSTESYDPAREEELWKQASALCGERV